MFGVIENFLEANVTFLQIQLKLSGLFTPFRGIFINILQNLWQQNASWNYHDTVLMKELADTIYSTTAFVQHLIRTEEIW